MPTRCSARHRHRGYGSGHGTIQYSTNGGSTWTNVGSVSTTNALLLAANANTRVRIVPSDTYLGTVTDAITFRAWDQTSGTAGSYASTTSNGGSTAFSTATDTVSMTIDPAVGPMIQANSDSTGSHTPVGTALDGQGNSVVAWTINNGTNTNLFAQSYQRSGTAIGAQFQVNPAGTSVSSAAVAMNASGTSIFVWSTYSSSTYTVYSQRFNNSTGAAVDASPVSLFSDPYVKNLSVGIAANGSFVVSFATSSLSAFTNNDFLVSNQVLTATNQTTTGSNYYAVLACMYDANNVFQNGNPITVATTTSPAYIYNSALSVAGDGSFVVDWETYGSSTYQLQALRYTASGTLLDTSTPLQVLAAQSTSIGGTTVAEQADGSFVVAWNEFVSSTDQIWARRFNSAASSATAVEVTSTAYGTIPDVAVDGLGDFGVVWLNGSAAPSVWGQFYNASSQPESGIFPIDVGDPGYGVVAIAIGADSQGDFATAWESVQGSNYEVLTQRLRTQPGARPIRPASRRS